MIYYTFNEEGRYTGSSGIEPTHSNWTLTPYQGGLVKEKCVNDEWIESATPEEIAEATKAQVPQVVSKRQLKQALVLSQIPLGSIDEAILQIVDETEKALMQIYWKDSNEFERHHPKLIEFSQTLGITEQQADNLFILAGTL